MTLHYICDSADTGRTLFTVLRYRLHMSAGMIRRCKFQTIMYVNDEPAHTDLRLKAGDRIELPLPAEQADFPPEPGALRILYEDESLIALFKPAGIIIHPSATRMRGTLANRLLSYLGGGTIHCLNRLDRDTTGVTVFAKNSYIKSILTEQLLAAQIHKSYIAPVYGALPETSGVIDLPIDRVGESSLFRCIREDGQPSRTAYKLISGHGLWNLYRFHPLTGRTHQIRLHCQASGAPILGDPYYHSDASAAFSDSLGLTVQQLCCTEMSFMHPMTGQPLSITVQPEFINADWFQADHKEWQQP